VCFLLGNSPSSELPKRKRTTYRTRRKFEFKKEQAVPVAGNGNNKWLRITGKISCISGMKGSHLMFKEVLCVVRTRENKTAFSGRNAMLLSVM